MNFSYLLIQFDNMSNLFYIKIEMAYVIRLL
jgi:hypothetical protein